jgi:putative aldouronate transport system permease protein
MIIILILTLYPFIYVVLYSFSDSSKAFGRFLFFPLGINVDAYRMIFNSTNVLNGLLISVLRSVIGPVCTILVIYMGAYALSKKELVARKFFLRFILITMYFTPGIIPIYILIVKLNLNNTFWVYIVPRLVNVYEMILIRVYIESLPDSLSESAYLDGANDFTIAFRIIFPLCLPVIAAVGLFECVHQWNAFQDTLFYNASNSSLHPMQYVLVTFIQSRAATPEQAEALGNTRMLSSTSLRMAMTVITILPVTLVYPFLQRYFVKGLLVGSIKG